MAEAAAAHRPRERVAKSVAEVVGFAPAGQKKVRYGTM